MPPRMTGGTMKWDDLRIFLALARQSRLMSAGKSLGLDPATVSRRITVLEEAMGTQLFERSPQGYMLTNAGRSLIAHAQAMEANAAAAHDDLGGTVAELAGTVRIGAPDGVLSYLLTDACELLSRENPDLQIQVVALPRTFQFSKRDADLAITASPPTAGRLTVHKISDYRLGLYARPDLVKRSGSLRSLADLNDLRGIGYISDMVFDRELDYFAFLGRDREPELTSNSLIVQLHWCLKGAGFCVLPDFVAREHSGLQLVLPEDIRLTRSFYLIRHQDDARSGRINRIAEVIVACMTRALEGRDRSDAAPAA